MRLLTILAILLALPIGDIYLSVRLTREFGPIVPVWLLLAAIVGIALLRSQRAALPARLLHGLTQGNQVGLALWATFREVIAALLLIFPGVVSDAIALGLLLMPPRRRIPDSSPGVIDGDYTVVEESAGADQQLPRSKASDSRQRSS